MLKRDDDYCYLEGIPRWFYMKDGPFKRKLQKFALERDLQECAQRAIKARMEWRIQQFFRRGVRQPIVNGTWNESKPPLKGKPYPIIDYAGRGRGGFCMECGHFIRNCTADTDLRESSFITYFSRGKLITALPRILCSRCQEPLAWQQKPDNRARGDYWEETGNMWDNIVRLIEDG